MICLWCWTAALTVVVVVADSSSSKNDGNESQPVDWLSEDSVVLITGAAGFIGSELALALYRTYNVRKLLLVDRMGGHTSSSSSSSKHLALFEFQRQRLFATMQTLQQAATFYRADLRPYIPDYYVLGEISVLEHIFEDHPDITHIVHLADPYPHTSSTENSSEEDDVMHVKYREANVPKAGMMEAILEHLVDLQKGGKRVPHFTYASSSEVYPLVNPNNSSSILPFRETMDISVPSSLRGASKVIDETYAKLYYDMHQVYSVGLRFFDVYGPWATPGSTLFELAERAVSGETLISTTEQRTDTKGVRDYVYIDDAVDAIMSAMQFRPIGDSRRSKPPPPVVINVASGQGTSLDTIASMMESYFPPTSGNKKSPIARQREEEIQANSESSSFRHNKVIHAYGSTERAHRLLNFEPRVSLTNGIIKLLAWHYDRTYPFGNSDSQQSDGANYIASQGIASCEPYDNECLKGATIFPCASECSHVHKCTPSFYDGVLGWTQKVTEQCETVLYTVALNNDLESFTATDFVKDGNCNLAFVSASSRLVQNAVESSSTKMLHGKVHLQHNDWTLIPLEMIEGDNGALSLLPKLSPSVFFGPNTKHAIFIDATRVSVDSIPKVLEEASKQPSKEDIEDSPMSTATALLIGKLRSKDFVKQTLDIDDDDDVPVRQVFQSKESMLQNSAYRIVRMALADDLSTYSDDLDTPWMVHTLQSEDSQSLRCDVYGEVLQWGSNVNDKDAFDFVLELHDMWSRMARDLPILDDPELAQTEDGDSNVEEDDDDDHDTTVDEGGAQQEAAFGGGSGEADQQKEEDEEGVTHIKIDTKLETSGEDDEESKRSKGDNTPEQEARILNAESASVTWMGVLSAAHTKYFVRVAPSESVGIKRID